MKIALTGGSGAIGRVLVHHLMAEGHEIVSLDITTCGQLPCPEIQLTLTDYHATYAALEGADAVVHFGANPYPDEDHRAASDRFGNNTIGAFNVFNAALARGINRIVWASSETVFGYPFRDNSPVRIPVCEEDLAPQTGYAMSKLVSEDCARMLCRLHPEATIIGLRLSNVLYADALSASASDSNKPLNRKRDTYVRLPGYWDDIRSRDFNLWDYVDARDVCSAVDCALRVDLKGAHACAIIADDTIMNRPTRELVKQRFPKAKVDPSLGEFEAAVSNSYAREILGWQPRWSWRDVPELKAMMRGEAA